ncbi:helix-turn-helix domain-containing protein [Aeromicrobium sp. A1-2]|uniref:helix-turn-helix domain-containing protein n=1 Tax=Aeromicrobium sp. A1-2 TaxID=2107713 RepID=UPI0013C34BCC|nr:helix-turn-helix domain-containing protein [Aeromicrobium sp. A1-2]
MVVTSDRESRRVTCREVTPLVTTTPDPLLTFPQAAEYLQHAVSERTLRRLVARGDLQALRIGDKLVRLRVSALENYLTRSEL